MYLHIYLLISFWKCNWPSSWKDIASCWTWLWLDFLSWNLPGRRKHRMVEMLSSHFYDDLFALGRQVELWKHMSSTRTVWATRGSREWDVAHLWQRRLGGRSSGEVIWTTCPVPQCSVSTPLVLKVWMFGRSKSSHSNFVAKGVLWRHMQLPCSGIWITCASVPRHSIVNKKPTEVKFLPLFT